MYKKHTVSIVSLGCAKNSSDSERLLGSFKDRGYQLVGSDDNAEIIIINTCAFLISARNEADEEILYYIKRKKEGLHKTLMVAGCLTDYYKDRKELAEKYPDVDQFIAPDDLDESLSRILIQSPYSAYLKVADGCDHMCSFCSIPFIRGKYRSRSIEDIVNEAAMLVKAGVRELCLVAQDVTAYGIDLYGEYVLPKLLKELCNIEELNWIRLLYTYPDLVSDELIDIINKEEKICNYLDMPLQHIADDILASMGRLSSSESIKSKIKRIKAAIPEIALRTTFIVGYPGETDAQFKELLKFLGEIKFNKVGVFTYSPEPHTRACNLPDQVPENIKEERFHKLMRAQREISREINKLMVGKKVSVLVESHKVGRVVFDAPEVDGLFYFENTSPQPSSLVQALVTGWHDYDLKGDLLSG